MSLTIMPFSCRRDSFQIRGREYHQVEGKLIPIILSHGFTSNMSKTEAYAKFLAALGYRTFIFDFVGGGYASTSDGSIEKDMTPLTEVKDLESVINYVLSRDDVEKDKLILMGCSLGGLVSALTASQEKERVNKLLLIYPAFCVEDHAKNGEIQFIRFDPEHITDTLSANGLTVSGNFAKDAISLDTYNAIKGFKGPVYIIHGSEDQIVPVRYADKAVDVYQKNGNDVEIDYIEGAPHGFTGKYLEEACALLQKYLEK